MKDNESKKFILDEKIGNELIAYLVKRPFEEVFELINKLQTLPEYNKKENTKDG